MVNPQGLEPTKIPLTYESGWQGIYSSDNHGPTFGGRSHSSNYALKISDKANISCSESDDRNRTYYFPPEHTNIFTGTSRFLVTDYEVFSLI